MTTYCLGFAFDTSRNDVVLICKTKPAWQAGKLNGVGGKVEEDEAPIEAMVREFREETGVTTVTGDWIYRGYMSGEGFHIDVFAMYSDQIFGAMSTTEEAVDIYNVYRILRHQCISNVPALIELCRLPHAPPSGDPALFTLLYKGSH